MGMKKNLAIVACGVAAVVSLPGPCVFGASHHRAVAHHRAYRHAGNSTVSLVVDRAPIQTVLQVLFRRGHHNFVMGQGVSGNVTASLHDVSFATALRQVLSVNSVPLTETHDNGIYVIAVRPPSPPRVATRPITPAAPPAYAPPAAPAPVAPTYVLPATGGTVRVVP